MILELSNRQSRYKVKVWYQLLRELLPAALATASQKAGLYLPDQAGVFLMLAGPVIMRRINQDQRQIAAVTDVLAFPLLDLRGGPRAAGLAGQDFAYTSQGKRYLPLGDIIICPAVAAGQAATYGHSLDREIAFLAVHGLLHLLGFDHASADEEKAMLRLQEEILQAQGLGR